MILKMSFCWQHCFSQTATKFFPEFKRSTMYHKKSHPLTKSVKSKCKNWRSRFYRFLKMSVQNMNLNWETIKSFRTSAWLFGTSNEIILVCDTFEHCFVKSLLKIGWSLNTRKVPSVFQTLTILVFQKSKSIWQQCTNFVICQFPTWFSTHEY